MLVTNSSSKSFFGSQPVVLWIKLGVIFIVGLGNRLYDLTDPSLDFCLARHNDFYDRVHNHYFQLLKGKAICFSTSHSQ